MELNPKVLMKVKFIMGAELLSCSKRWHILSQPKSSLQPNWNNWLVMFGCLPLEILPFMYNYTHFWGSSFIKSWGTNFLQNGWIAYIFNSNAKHLYTSWYIRVRISCQKVVRGWVQAPSLGFTKTIQARMTKNLNTRSEVY